MSDNEPVDAPGALLIAPDPTGQSEVRLEHICDLSPEAYQREDVPSPVELRWRSGEH